MKSEIVIIKANFDFRFAPKNHWFLPLCFVCSWEREEFNEQLPLFPLTKGKWVSQVHYVNSDFLMLFQILKVIFTLTWKPQCLEDISLTFCLTKQMNSLAREKKTHLCNPYNFVGLYVQYTWVFQISIPKLNILYNYG